MQNYQKAAIHAVKTYAQAKVPSHQAYVDSICEPFNISGKSLAGKVLKRPVTINFHPDRLSNNGKTVIENLLAEGQYLSQFSTGTTNGGTGIFAGGNRFTWEQNLFADAYPHQALDRPKYGALNLFKYLDGASARFGSCFFMLKPAVQSRCTFAYGDSSTNPTTLCTGDTFIGIIAAMFADVKANGRLLNQVVASERMALATMLNPSVEMKHMGRNLDYCIETHIHGDVSLADDVDCFYMDESFRGTIFHEHGEVLCKKYGIKLGWTPRRQMHVADIDGIFRSEKMPPLARRIDSEFGGSSGDNSGIITAALIGHASRDSMINADRWRDFGTEADMFMYFKQLWHTIAYFG